MVCPGHNLVHKAETNQHQLRKHRHPNLYEEWHVMNPAVQNEQKENCRQVSRHQVSGHIHSDYTAVTRMTDLNGRGSLGGGFVNVSIKWELKMLVRPKGTNNACSTLSKRTGQNSLLLSLFLMYQSHHVTLNVHVPQHRIALQLTSE